MYHIHNKHFQWEKKILRVKRPAVLHTKDRIKKSQFFRLEKEKNKILGNNKMWKFDEQECCSSTNTKKGDDEFLREVS